MWKIFSHKINYVPLTGLSLNFHKLRTFFWRKEFFKNLTLAYFFSMSNIETLIESTINQQSIPGRAQKVVPIV